VTPLAQAALRRFAPRTPLAAPQDLTLPSPGSTTVRDLVNRYIPAILRDFFALPLTRLSPARARELARLQQLVAELSASEPGAIVSLVRRPTFSVLVRCLTHEIAAPKPNPQADKLAAELVEQGLFDLALMGASVPEIVLDRPITRLASQVHDVTLELDAPAMAARFSSGSVELTLTSGERFTYRGDVDVELPPSVRREQPFPRLFAQTSLALRDNNPLALFEAHPDKDGNAIDLGGHSVDAWASSLRGAFELVEKFLPEIADEMRLVLQQVVPVGYFDERHLSASYAEAIGTVYMSLHPNPLTMTEALVHEFQHNKLNAFLYFDAVLTNREDELYASPVRPDPRPLRGVLLAVHAFLPIARFYERLIASGELASKDEDLRKRLKAIVEVNREGCEVLLPNARPTALGRSLFAEIARLNEEFAGY